MFVCVCFKAEGVCVDGVIGYVKVGLDKGLSAS